MKIKIIEPYDLNPKYDQRSLTPNPGPIVVASLLDQAGHQVEVVSEYVTKFNAETIDEADLIVAKGQGNYETLSEVEKDIYFLLKVKCPVIARDLDCAIGSLVLRRSRCMSAEPQPARIGAG